MALATFTSTSYGIRATGGTDATVLTDMKAKVAAFVFIAASTNDTCAITDADGSPVITITSTGTAGDIVQVDWYDTRIDGLRITLSNAAGVLIALLC